jgi:acyl-CoA thioesterase
MTPDALARACAEKMWAEDEASRGLGMRIDHIAPGQARLSMTVAPSMVNGHGMCHGGFIFTLADSAFAFACNTYNQQVVAAQCAITYLRPAHLHDKLIAEATERAREGRQGIYDITIRRGEEIIAEFRGHSRTTGGTFFPAP